MQQFGINSNVNEKEKPGDLHHEYVNVSVYRLAVDANRLDGTYTRHTEIQEIIMKI